VHKESSHQRECHRLGAMDELALIYQCAFCGSYALWVVGVLDQHDIQLRIKFSKLKHQQHEAEDDVMLACSRAKCKARVAFLPCTTCLEYHRSKRWSEILGEDWVRKGGDAAGGALGDTPIGLSPQVPVRFVESSGEAGAPTDDEMPPVYRCVSGKWTLAQGLGPKVLDVMKNADSVSRLSAQQFKVLLKGKVFPLLSRKGDGDGKASAKAPSRTAPSEKSGSPSCAEEDVRRFLKFLWSEVPDYEEVVRTVMFAEELGTYANITHFVVSAVFCSSPDDLEALEARIHAEPS